MRDQERQRIARRKWYYKNRHNFLKGPPYLETPDSFDAVSREVIKANALRALEKARTGFAIYHERRKQEILKRVKPDCKFCGKPIQRNNRLAKFCNAECLAEHRKSTRRYWPEKCTLCGASCKRGNKYCKPCYDGRLFRAPKTVEHAKGLSLRKLLFSMRGKKCEVCHLDTWLGLPMPVEVHHVDGDADNGREENLQVVCPNCHALTQTFRNKNNRRASESRRKTRKTVEFSPRSINGDALAL